MSDDKRQESKMSADELSAGGETKSAGNENAMRRELQGAIGKQLKHVYGQMLAEPLPDKFTQLLASLSKPESNS